MVSVRYNQSLGWVCVCRPTVQPASVLGFEKGLCAEWAASSSSSFPVSPPHFPGQQTLGRGENVPLLSESLSPLVFISSEEGYDLGREA